MSMPSKRTPIRRDRLPIVTAQLVELWRELRAIATAGADQCWEEAGGRRAEFLSKHLELDRALGMKLWQMGPLELGMLLPMVGQRMVSGQGRKRGERTSVRLTLSSERSAAPQE